MSFVNRRCGLTRKPKGYAKGGKMKKYKDGEVVEAATLTMAEYDKQQLKNKERNKQIADSEAFMESPENFKKARREDIKQEEEAAAQKAASGSGSVKDAAEKQNLRDNI